MSSLSERDPRLYVEDMIAFCDRVLAYTAGLDLAALAADRMRYDATLRNLELVGEAATRVTPEWRQRAPQVPWRQVVATRNRLIHAYLGIDDDTIWSIVSEDVPALREHLAELLRTA
jgi:uncharacterized protein with HEPN domain